LIKAHFVSEELKLPAIADDSGIEVDALGGEPGVYSARYGNKNSDQERRDYMLEQLQHAPSPRKARFCSKSVSHRGRALEKFLTWLQSEEATQAFKDNNL